MYFRKRYRFSTLAMFSFLILAIILLGILFYYHSNSHALWQIVSQRCIPGSKVHQQTNPCAKVELKQGYVLIKDRVGVLQYLLIPTERISGVGSTSVLKASTPNFFSQAWEERKMLSYRYGERIDDQTLSLAINSRWGRTQDQLHIHISCLKPEVAQQIQAFQANITQQWQKIILVNHPYQIRLISRQQLAQQSPFRIVAHELPRAKLHMEDYGIAMVSLGKQQLALLAIQTQWWRGILGASEELQDHSCQMLAGED